MVDFFSDVSSTSFFALFAVDGAGGNDLLPCFPEVFFPADFFTSLISSPESSDESEESEEEDAYSIWFIRNK